MVTILSLPVAGAGELAANVNGNDGKDGKDEKGAHDAKRGKLGRGVSVYLFARRPEGGGCWKNSTA